MHASLYFAADLIKKQGSQIFVDAAQEGVNHGKTYVMGVVYFILLSLNGFSCFLSVND
jgi:hypothetical protein